MKRIARFVIRPAADGRGDLILGALMKDQGDLLKPDRVYEIHDVLGEPMLLDKGPAVIGTQLIQGVSWNCSVNDILHHGGLHLLTTAEFILHGEKPVDS